MSGDVVLDLGLQPACEYFPPLGDTAEDPVFPLRLWLCATCGLAQLADDADLPDEPEGVEPVALTVQRHDAVAAAHAVGMLPPGASVAEGATPHGGSWAAELTALGLHMAEPGAPADVVVDGTFGMMHARDQAAALDALLDLVKPDGVLLFQYHTLAAMLREQQWNAVRLGHYAYYSLPVLQQMLDSRGWTVTHAWVFPLYGGTVLIAASRGGSVDPAVDAVVAGELATGVVDAQALRGLQNCVESSTAALRALTRTHAAPVHSSTATELRRGRWLCCSWRISRTACSPAWRMRHRPSRAAGSQGRRFQSCRRPISWHARPDVVLLFVSDLMPEVRRGLPEIEAAGGRWVDAGTGQAA